MGEGESSGAPTGAPVPGQSPQQEPTAPLEGNLAAGDASKTQGQLVDDQESEDDELSLAEEAGTLHEDAETGERSVELQAEDILQLVDLYNSLPIKVGAELSPYIARNWKVLSKIAIPSVISPQPNRKEPAPRDRTIEISYDQKTKEFVGNFGVILPDGRKTTSLKIDRKTLAIKEYQDATTKGWQKEQIHELLPPLPAEYQDALRDWIKNPATKTLEECRAWQIERSDGLSITKNPDGTVQFTSYDPQTAKDIPYEIVTPKDGDPYIVSPVKKLLGYAYNPVESVKYDIEPNPAKAIPYVLTKLEQYWEKPDENLDLNLDKDFQTIWGKLTKTLEQFDVLFQDFIAVRDSYYLSELDLNRKKLSQLDWEEPEETVNKLKMLFDSSQSSQVKWESALSLGLAKEGDTEQDAFLAVIKAGETEQIKAQSTKAVEAEAQSNSDSDTEPTSPENGEGETLAQKLQKVQELQAASAKLLAEIAQATAEQSTKRETAPKPASSEENPYANLTDLFDSTLSMRERDEIIKRGEALYIDPTFRQIFEDECLKFLKTADKKFFSVHYNGERDADGYLLDRDGAVTSYLPSQNVSEGRERVYKVALEKFDKLT